MHIWLIHVSDKYLYDFFYDTSLDLGEHFFNLIFNLWMISINMKLWGMNQFGKCLDI